LTEAKAGESRRCVFEIRDRLKALETSHEKSNEQFIEHKAETKDALIALFKKVESLNMNHAVHDAAEKAAKSTLWKSALIVGGVMTFGLGLIQLGIALYQGGTP
jgi:hypothetical protein